MQNNDVNTVQLIEKEKITELFGTKPIGSVISDALNGNSLIKQIAAQQYQKNEEEFRTAIKFNLKQKKNYTLPESENSETVSAYEFILEFGKLGRVLYNQILEYHKNYDRCSEKRLSEIDMHKMLNALPHIENIMKKFPNTSSADATFKQYFGAISGYFKSLDSFYKNPEKFKAIPEYPRFKSYWKEPLFYVVLRRVKITEINGSYFIVMPYKETKESKCACGYNFPSKTDINRSLSTWIEFEGSDKLCPKCHRNLDIVNKCLYIPVLHHDRSFIKSIIDTPYHESEGFNVRIYPIQPTVSKDGKSVHIESVRIEIMIRKEEKLYHPIADIMSIDLGIKCLATCIFTTDANPILYKGNRIMKILKDYENSNGIYQAKLKMIEDKHRSRNYLRYRTRKDSQIDHECHRITRSIVNKCIENNCQAIIIGRNIDWKQNMKKEKRMNKESRKKFVTIPYSKLIGQIRYKAREAGIFVFCYDESYTSKIDHFANEPLEHKNESEYLGKRGYIGNKKVSIKWFTSSTGKVIHADVNGAIGILRKFYLSDLFDSSEKHDEIVNLFRNSKKIHNPITINEQYDHHRVPDE